MNINRTFSNILNSKPIITSRGYSLTNGLDTSASFSMTYTPLEASTLTSAATAVGSVATFDAGVPHRLQTGQQVEITGADVVAFNGVFQITVVSANVFTYVITKTASSTTAGGTPYVAYTPIFQQAILFAAAGNLGIITIGPDLNADLITLNAGDVYTIQAPDDNRQSMADWFFKSTTTAQNLSVIFV